MNGTQTLEAVESGPCPGQGGVAEGDEEGVWLRAGPEREPRVLLRDLWVVLGGAGKRGPGATICGLGLGVERWKENTQS